VAIIRFASAGVDKTVTVDVMPGERRTLLSAALDAGVPILFNCGTGDCAACLVHVDTLSTSRPESQPVAPLTGVEKLVLEAMSLLTRKDIVAAERDGIPPTNRLACQYALGDEEIVVSFESGLGGR